MSQNPVVSAVDEPELTVQMPSDLASDQTPPGETPLEQKTSVQTSLGHMSSGHQVLAQMRSGQRLSEQTVVETEIVAVTVYPDQALVTRQGTVTLTGQELELIVVGLPASLKPQSLRVGGSGVANVRLLSVETEKVSMELDQVTQLETLRKQLQQLEERYRHIKDHIASLQLQQQFVQGLSERTIETYAQGLAQQQLDLSQTQLMIEFLGDRHRHFSTAIAQQEQAKYRLDQQLQTIREQIQKQQDTPEEAGHIAIAHIQAETPGTYTLELSYRVGQASWTPNYDVRFNQPQTSLTLTYLAVVQQNSGEDWPKVKLTLSTAKPSLSLSPPELSPWVIETPRSLMGKGLGSKGGGSSRGNDPLLEAYRMLGAVPGTDISQAVQQLDREAATRDLCASRPIANFPTVESATIVSDNQGHSITIFSQPMGAQLAYIALPQRVNVAYLRAILHHPADAPPLLPGRVSLFRQSVFVGAAWLDYVAPGQSFSFDLGVEEQLQIKRTLTKRELEAADQHHHTLAFETVLTNHLSHGAIVRVIEHLPVSRSPQIQIQVDKLEPSATVNEAGLCQWQLTLEPGEQIQLSYQFTVDHPADLTVTGLDR
ncbi:MAG: mucoidy inhibitor MuiA family protein [Cyanobacteria bacterium P01_A01_bin.123]